jgi:enoyl-CoA hydratase/carnithine racemase
VLHRRGPDREPGLTSAADPVRYERHGPVATLTIDRPDARNAINRAVSTALFAGLARFDVDREARVLILTGAGSTAFCAGADVREIRQDQVAVPPADFLPQIGRNIDVHKPVVGAINGVCVGAGFMLAQNCDLLVAAEHATFAIPEVRIGRGSPWAAPLPAMIPRAVAMELMLTGQPISARRAYEVGLVNRVVTGDELQDSARELAVHIAGMAPVSVVAARRTVRLMGGLPLDAAFAQAEDAFVPAYTSPDAAEGIRALLERRAPRWRGEV